MEIVKPEITIKHIGKDGKPVEKWDFYIDRRTPVGNPFLMENGKDRYQVCTEYNEYFKLMTKFGAPEFCFYLSQIKKAYEKYGKVNLFCWCAPLQCHGETIREWLIQNY